MATRRLSPTASLLKNSRLFSLPPPLPRPSTNLTAGPISESDTATLPYPTHAAIETTSSSLSRGDWGLKRPLPLKSTTNSSTPTIRIDEVDSIDHITDFESAADHTLTLRKWQEIGLPISMPIVQKGAFVTGDNLNTRSVAPTSVFEEAFDNTERKTDAIKSQRWKFKGPWLAGKTEGEFDQYIDKNVKRRKLEFRNFIRDLLRREKITEGRRKAQESGEDFEGQMDVLEQDVDLYMKQLRGDEVRLQMLIEEFLDLPIAEDFDTAEGNFPVLMDNDKGPPSTHLSAGLSYLRTDAHMTNHPVLGPMQEEPPIQARILRPQRSGIVLHAKALLGIGGVAAEDSTKATSSRSRPEGRQEVPGIQKLEPDIEGGAKIWIRPDRASIDVHGKPKVHILRVDPGEKIIYEGVEETEYTTSWAKTTPLRSMPQLDSLNSSKPARTSNYGLTHEDAGQSSQRATPINMPKGTTNSTQRVLELLDSTGNR
ncbi:MAG: hypothetical protein LQ341_000667 [Variospora aurantia]|nr:MAG: hypothetical protein LQ341_000667 [Variospora aurantia]